METVDIAIFYYLFYFVLFANLISSFGYTNLPPTWIGSTTFNLEFSFVKVLLVVFWCIYVYFLNTYFKNDYFKNGIEKIFCIDLAFCGSILFLSAADMLELFLGLELIAFPTYTLIALDKTKASSEGVLKYFVYSVYGSLLLILSFVVLFMGTGQTSFNEIAYFTDSTRVELAIILLTTAFFIKLGIGPFFHWAPPVYQSTSAPTFVFVSTITKIPFIYPLIYLAKSYSFMPHSWAFFYTVTLLVWGCILASRDLFGEKDIRRILAFTSTINFSIATLALVFSLFNVKIFISFIVVYLLSNLGVFTWHFLLNSDKFNKNEITNLDKFNKEDKVAVTLLNLSTIFNSGLPPAIVFIFKVISIGAITYWQASNTNFFSFFVAAITMATSLFAYNAYFKILKSVNYVQKNATPDLYGGVTNKNHEKYMWATNLTLVNLAVFLFTIYLI
jgi:NADH-quinone oxidoreductase subunit N